MSSHRHAPPPPPLRCEALWKIFGAGVEKLARDKALLALSPSKRAAALRAEGYIIGAEDVNFSVQAGELFVLMGLSGSGKSTILRLIAQLQSLTFGHVFLDGVCLDNLGAAELRAVRRRKMGMVFQHFGLIPHFTALQNIAFPLKIRGEARGDALTKAGEMLDLVGLAGRGDAYPAELSGGQQQRVGIARSLAVDPDIWLLDEPFSALDPLIRRQLQDELLELQARLKKTIVFVTHDFSEAVRLADRIAIMRGGRIVQLGRAADLLLRPADDYVARFVQDVSRLQVLKLADVMTASKRRPHGYKDAVSLDANMSLEACLLQLPAHHENIIVTDSKGKPIGHCARGQLAAVAEAR